ncbi:phage minor capsid protein [Streptomyces albipurpureus]|uniref:Phage minor capsid protein n=1 Tax=Streptomyces albipurpureus TaxID=2897419 RepID=A0ABT0V0Y7_9ACTN|nr:phage minor capsid protein [Streptomyces sp. CWNU-1]MCM2394352.1 phage minor capsid protein [Streptomyces sp. CWNU-1]
MPVSPEMAENLAAEVRGLYDAAETVLLEKLAAALEADIDSPRWAELKLASLGNLRQSIEQVAEALQQDTDGAVRRALIEAYTRGRQAAVAELGALDIGRELVARETLPNAPAVDRLAASLAEDTRPVYARITRAITDTYRRVVARASGTQLLTGITRRQASQRALDEFANRGITGFIDSAGRSWDMAAYAEMAVRSVTARAAIEGHTDALTEMGIQLVIVSDAPLNCPLCAAWEGEILAINGQSGPHTIRAEHAAPTGRRRGRRRTVAVHVAGSLVEARAAGLFHPNCRHSLAAYLPGITTRPPHHATPGTTYEDTQRQREIERHIRRWKRRAAAAMDDKTRATANAKVREWQAEMRKHVAAHDDLRRKPEREQIPPPTQDAAPEPPPSSPAPSDAEPDEQPSAIRQGPAGFPLLDDLISPVPSDQLTDEQREAVRHAIAGVLDGDYAGLTIRTGRVKVEQNYTHVSAGIYMGENMVGDVIRQLRRDDTGALYVVHSYFDIADEHQNSGMSGALNARLEAWYRDSGVERIELHASMQVGGYAWASAGYSARDAEAAQYLLERLQGAIERAKEDIQRLEAAAETGGGDPEELASLRAQVLEAAAILERAAPLSWGEEGFPEPQEISQAGRGRAIPPSDGSRMTWVGKKALMGSSWYGVKWL